MDTTGLVLGVAQVVVQVAGVIKRHVNAFSSLHPLAASIESKATRTYRVANRLSALAEISGLSADLFRYSLEDLVGVRDRLQAIEKQISRWKKIGFLFLQAPVLKKSLEELNTELTLIDHQFRTIGSLSTVITLQRKEARELAISTLSRFLISLGHPEQARQVIYNFEASLQTHTAYDIGLESNAEFAFMMGISAYDVKPEKARIVPITALKAQRAARYFNRATHLGKKEAFRYLGDVYYDGKGAEHSYQRATELYMEGVARDDAGAKFALGWCHLFGHGVEECPSRAVELYEQAVDEGCGEALAEVGFLKLHGLHMETNHGEAARLLKKAMKMNAFAAKENLAWCYQKGIGIDRDPDEAFKLFSQAFNGGNLLTAAALADCYDRGIGVQKNPMEAARVYERCMSSGTWPGDFFKACYGLRLVRGLGVQKDEPRGKAMIIDATRTGSAYSWHALGECYRYGYGVLKDCRQAKKFYWNAIEGCDGILGIMNSYVALGEMFEIGEGVLPDIRKACKFYLAAAHRLSPIGQWKVALAFESGVGMHQNVHRAVYFYEMCANCGYKEAQRKYLTYYMKGHGVERSRVKARRMLENVAQKGSREIASLFRSV